MPKINIFNTRTGNKKDGEKETLLLFKDLKKTTEIVLAFFKDRGFFLDVYLVEDKEMRRLNKKFRGKDKITNVLSFKEPDKFPHPEIKGTKNKKSVKKPKYLGEVYLAPAYIKARGEDIHYLLIHGILHLFGYTHNNKNDTIRMVRREDKILKHLQDVLKTFDI